jgi:hypothetical protein
MNPGLLWVLVVASCSGDPCQRDRCLYANLPILEAIDKQAAWRMWTSATERCETELNGVLISNEEIARSIMRKLDEIQPSVQRLREISAGVSQRTNKRRKQ